MKVTLKEGHSGIFEVAANGEVIYNNQNQCGRLPTEAEIFARIRGEAENAAPPQASGGC